VNLFVTKALKIFALGSLAAFAIVGLNRCGSDEPASYTYNGAGSYYKATLNGDGTCNVLKYDDVESTTETQNIACTFERRADGFVVVTVTSATGTNAPAAGQQGIAVEVPGMALLLVPIGGSGELIGMVQAGNCPTDNLNANWVNVGPNADQIAKITSSQTFDSFGEPKKSFEWWGRM